MRENIETEKPYSFWFQNLNLVLKLICQRFFKVHFTIYLVLLFEDVVNEM